MKQLRSIVIENREYDHCPNLGTPLLYSDDTKPETRIIHKAMCKLWTCPYCAPIIGRQIQNRIADGIKQLQNQGRCFNFVTLTSHEKLHGFEQTYRVWQSAWRKLSQRYRRYCAKKLRVVATYVWVLETHKDGRIHIHGFYDAGISKRWWKNNARACGLGYQCDVQPVQNAGHAVSYVTKYLTKQQGQVFPISRVRRVNFSADFPVKASTDTVGTWSIADAKTAITDLIEEAWHVKHLDVELNGTKVIEIIDNS